MRNRKIAFDDGDHEATVMVMPGEAWEAAA
jgi:hypothetical protein